MRVLLTVGMFALSLGARIGAQGTSGRLVVLNKDEATLVTVDAASGKVLGRVATGEGPHEVAVSEDERTAFGSNTISIIERGANPLAWNETVVPVGRGPEGFDVSPDGRELWAAHSQDGGVSVVDLAAKKVTATLDLQTKRSNRLKFTRDGRLVLISDLDAGRLVVVDAASRQETKRLALGRMPEGILIPPDGTKAYVAVAGDGLVAVVDLTTLEVTRKMETGRGPDGMAWVR